ncbi:MAG: UDP-N-acetyl-D-glucosamine dehydrogenase [Elusimicrobia bacterium CG03_land_8_20_14_0_80_50_18]|nr:MAG: UDP-N-acetyl-D-glucosamine dehydrogenase [Elusimicrobia bacterium CG03_land_8_20_14_0_80_50_18]
MKIAVVGLGYVGLPLACAFAEKGAQVYGVDISADKISMLNKGVSYVGDIKSSGIKEHKRKGLLTVSTDFSIIKDCGCIAICVPTPLRKTQDPDISYIIASCEKIKDHIKKGAVVVLESTTYPGTTREVVRGILEKKNFKAGKDFFLAFSPERIDPSNKKWNVKNTPKVIGGINKASLDKAVHYYSLAIEHIVPASSLEAAEMVKLLENTFRAVNIGLINEMAQISDRLGLDVWEIVNLAATKPYGFMPFYPGPGLGGHCIPIDPLYLSWKMKSLNFYTRFIDLASEINGAMPHFTVMKLATILNGFSKSVKGSKIIILGVAYKKDVSDTRESPALELISELEEMGADVSWYDDLITYGEVPRKRLKKLSPDSLKKADMVVIATDHSHFDYDFIVKKSKRIFDLRNTLPGRKSAKIFKL